MPTERENLPQEQDASRQGDSLLSGDMHLLPPDDKLYQGAIFSNLYVPASASEGEPQEFKVDFCILITQQCDLDKDRITKQKNMNTVSERQFHHNCLLHLLFCPAYNIELFRQGTYLNNEGLTADKWGGKTHAQEGILNNTESRYHYIAKSVKYKLPELIIDFNRVFSMHCSYFDEDSIKKYCIAYLSTPYREHLSLRFAFNLCRIGLQYSHKEINKSDSQE